MRGLQRPRVGLWDAAAAVPWPLVVVKCRSSRRRSSAPDFQIAYSSESARACAEAAMMFVSLPIVDHVVEPSCESMMTRVRAAVAGRAVEDAHLVVDEVDRVEHRVERPQRLAQRAVERVDRAVAVGGGVQHLAVDLDLDRRLGEQLAPGPLLDEHGVVDDPERRRVVGRVAPDQQLERRLGALEREALVLELLDQLRELPGVDARPRARGPAAGRGSRCSPCRPARTRRAGPRCRRRPGRRAGSCARPWPRPRRGRRPCARTPTGRRTAGSRWGPGWRSPRRRG